LFCLSNTDKNATDEASEEERSLSDEEEVTEVMVDVSGHPMLPARYVVDLKTRQDIVREIFTKAYCKFKLSRLTIIF
jgi:hypothetical protein